ncbi:MAG: hypothetical protein BWK79_12525 [Beggiatoa sp. IS2]|nr:MAG: hypothetical protein BWK79_12525 [Beggiatoa sp. IS2]
MLRCHGSWTLAGIQKLEKQLATFSYPAVATLIIDGSDLDSLDTAGAWLLYRTQQVLVQNGQIISLHGFTEEHLTLLNLMTNYTVALQPLAPLTSPPFLENLGQRAYFAVSQTFNFLAFIGETTLTLLRAVLLPRHIRWRALFTNLQTAGLNALPIVGLLSFLMGIVLAYQGGTQLRQYGANIFIVNLVGITLLREMSPLLTAIIVAGRSGSAYTAQIGTMIVTNEVDALRTLGISPMELLVLPKLLALIIALPLLTAFADVCGIIGGMLIANLSLDVSFYDFLDRLPQAVPVNHYLIGIGKSPVFAAVIALVGCYQGFRVAGGADSVGKQVTTSVVQAIFLVIIVDAFFSILFSWLGI